MKSLEKIIKKLVKKYDNLELEETNLIKSIIRIKVYMKRTGVRIDIWTHFMRECIMDYVH